MPTSTDTAIATTDCEPVVLPISPFVSNNYHFGMLLGVTDLDTDQGYHRGKAWLETGWLHGEGVVWGFDVQVDAAHREIKVEPGLAITAAGRDVYLDRELCVDVGAWFDQRRPDDLEVEDRADGAKLFDVHLLAHPRVCLDRPVPAISEPCNGGGGDTAYSRAVETAQLTLESGPAPDRIDKYVKLRQFLGVLPATDAEVVDARNEVASAADPTAIRLRWLRAFAADDATALAPPTPTAVPFAADADAAVVLADLHVVLLSDGAGGWSITDTGADATTVDIRVRPAHVATTTITELFAGDGAGGTRGSASGGAQLDPTSAAKTDTEITVTATADLDSASVGSDAVSITAFDGGWTTVAPSDVSLGADNRTITATLTDPIAAPLVRLIVAGTGPTPVLDTAHVPLAGVRGAPVNPPDVGTDAVLMLRS